MKKTFLRLVVTLFVAFFAVTGFTTEKTYASSRKCVASGCSNYCKSSSIYCYKHECSKTSCHNKAINQGYCSTHASKSSSSSYKSSGSSKSGKRTSGYKSSSSKKSSKKKRYYEMPDCDDYEDYDDFMDDWDGCMPDDSDAEDYWDNW